MKSLYFSSEDEDEKSGLKKTSGKCENGERGHFRNEWEEMDDLQKKLLKDQGQQQRKGKLKNKKVKERPNKVARIKAYENALQKHDKECTTFYPPFPKPKLNLDEKQTIETLKRAKEQQIDVGSAVRSVGVRSVRSLYKCGVNEQLGIIIKYLETGQIPRWMKQHHEDLLAKQF